MQELLVAALGSCNVRVDITEKLWGFEVYFYSHSFVEFSAESFILELVFVLVFSNGLKLLASKLGSLGTNHFTLFG